MNYKKAMGWIRVTGLRIFNVICMFVDHEMLQKITPQINITTPLLGVIL